MTVRSRFTVIKVSTPSDPAPKVWIVDQCGGTIVSVTNDAEAVCQHMHNHYPNHRIIYRDTDGRWDELIHRQGKFITYGAVRQDDKELIP